MARRFTWREVTVRVRNLDSGEETLRSEPMWVPPEETARRAQLLEHVRRDHPAARPKSFSGWVAGFVDGRRLVVARYGDPADPPSGERAPDDWQQAALFGGAA